MLPGRKGRPHATHKVSIGEFAEGRPQKDSKFSMRRFDRQTKRWVLNDDLQARLIAALEELGAPQPQEPTWVPVITPYQTPEEAVFSELAMWAAGRYVCHCTAFALKTPATCQEQGLAWPIPGGEENAGVEYYVGAAQRNYWKMQDSGKGHELKARETITCDPATCPFAQGLRSEKDVELYEAIYGRRPSENAVGGAPLCKPHTVVPLILPWVGNDSPRAKYTTSAWSSSRALLRTLDEIYTATGGVLCGLPLRLVLKWQQQQTPMGAQYNPLVEFEPMVDWRRLALVGGEHAQMLKENAEAQAQVRTQLMMLKGVEEEDAGDAAEGVAFQQEFAAGVGEEEPFGNELERRLRELAGKAGWTPPEIDKALAEADSDNDVLDLIGVLEDKLGIRDADFEDAPEEGEGKPLVEVDEPFEEMAEKDAEAKVGEDGQAEMEV